MSRSSGIAYLLGVCALLAACGGRTKLLNPELFDGADDDDTPPLGSGKAGASSQGGLGTTGGSSGATGGKGSVPTGGATGTPQAGAPSEGGAGGSDQPPLSDHDYYVDPKLGSDDNPGTEDAPFKTIEHAAEVAIGGDTIWLAEGGYNWMTEPAFRADRIIYIADGVALRGRSQTPGYVDLMDQAEVSGRVVGGLEEFAQQPIRIS